MGGFLSGWVYGWANPRGAFFFVGFQKWGVGVWGPRLGIWHPPSEAVVLAGPYAAGNASQSGFGRGDCFPHTGILFYTRTIVLVVVVNQSFMI